MESYQYHPSLEKKSLANVERKEKNTKLLLAPLLSNLAGKLISLPAKYSTRMVN